MKNGKCPAGEYYCYTNKECKPIPAGFMVDPEGMLRKENGASTTNEEWTEKYKKSINCKNPKGFSQRAHCQGRKKKMREEKDHEISMAQTQLDKTIENARKLKKKLGTKEKNIPAWVQAKITDTDHNMDAASSYTEEVVSEEGLRDWFGKSKSKDGKRGWVNVVTGDSCASDKPGEGIPKCVSSAKRASMSKKERLAAAAAKRREDPGQQEKSGGAKPTMVKTDRKLKKEDVNCPVCGQDPCQCLEGTINEAKDKKGKGSGSKDACYHKVKSRYSVWPSAYASGALVKCRKVGAANWGNKSESFENLSPIARKVLGELTESEDRRRDKRQERGGVGANIDYSRPPAKKMTNAELGIKPGKTWVQQQMEKKRKENQKEEFQLDEKCWTGYTQKGMKKKGSKMVPNCVPVSEDMTRINQNGQTYSVILMWRGRTYTFQMFIPTMRRPAKQDIEREVRKVYPDARVLTFMPKQYDPTDPTIIIPEAYDSRNPKDMGNPDNSLRRAVKKLGGNPKDVLPSKLPLANAYEPESEIVEQIKGGKPGDGFIGPTIGGYGIPNPIRIAQDASDIQVRRLRQTVKDINAAGGGAIGNIKQTGQKTYNPSTSAAYNKLFGSPRRELRSDSYHPEDEMIEEGMSLKDFKANRKKNERKAASADAEKRGHVGKEWHNTGRKYSADEAKSRRAKMSDDDRAARHRAAVDPDDDRDENTYSADKTKNPKKLRKQKVMGESAAWTRKEGKNKEGGLNEKGRKSYERENPGSDLKAPSKKVGNKRRASFCARMSGMKKKLTSAKTANDPNSRINKSLRAWNC